jgi:hypothetical protein
MLLTKLVRGLAALSFVPGALAAQPLWKRTEEHEHHPSCSVSTVTQTETIFPDCYPTTETTTKWKTTTETKWKTHTETKWKTKTETTTKWKTDVRTTTKWKTAT